MDWRQFTMNLALQVNKVEQVFGPHGTQSGTLNHAGKMVLAGILAEQIGDVSDAYADWITLQPAVVRNNRARVRA